MEIFRDRNGVVVEHDALCRVRGHAYTIIHGDTKTEFSFQLGAVGDVGVNGPTNEALLSILIHRTRWLNNLFPCDQNEAAIQHMQEALMWFEERTRDRVRRGTEGRPEA